jgi:hypothetical protein
MGYFSPVVALFIVLSCSVAVRVSSASHEDQSHVRVEDQAGLALQVGAFGDVYNVRTAQNRVAGRYEVGQLELGLSASVDPRVGVEAAVARDGDAFALGVFAVDFRLMNAEESFFQAPRAIESLGVIVGQFDVPFGIDWHVYPSIDRLLVSTPLIVEDTHGGWNDYGVQGYLHAGRMNAVVYAVNGTAEWAAGGRVGLRVGGGVEAGFSLAGFYDRDEQLDSQLTGVDAQWSQGSFAAKGEYIRHVPEETNGAADNTRGLYAQGTWDAGRYFAVVRYGDLRSGAGDRQRLSAGLGWRLLETCQVRLEYQADTAADETLISQLVVEF